MTEKAIAQLFDFIHIVVQADSVTIDLENETHKKKTARKKILKINEKKHVKIEASRQRRNNTTSR